MGHVTVFLYFLVKYIWDIKAGSLCLTIEHEE